MFLCSVGIHCRFPGEDLMSEELTDRLFMEAGNLLKLKEKKS